VIQKKTKKTEIRIKRTLKAEATLSSTVGSQQGDPGDLKNDLWTRQGEEERGRGKKTKREEARMTRKATGKTRFTPSLYKYERFRGGPSYKRGEEEKSKGRGEGWEVERWTPWEKAIFETTAKEGVLKRSGIRCTGEEEIQKSLINGELRGQKTLQGVRGGEPREEETRDR